jgi:hypothetical protein
VSGRSTGIGRHFSQIVDASCVVDVDEQMPRDRSACSALSMLGPEVGSVALGETQGVDIRWAIPTAMKPTDVAAR